MEYLNWNNLFVVIIVDFFLYALNSLNDNAPQGLSTKSGNREFPHSILILTVRYGSSILVLSVTCYCWQLQFCYSSFL